MFLPGSVLPLAMTESKPLGGATRLESSMVMWCSLPRATSLRNMMPVFPAQRTIGRRCHIKHIANDWERCLYTKSNLTNQNPNTAWCNVPMQQSYHMQSQSSHHTICSRLAVFRGKVDALAYPPPRVWHDPEARLEYGCHHSHIGTVPQEATII